MFRPFSKDDPESSHAMSALATACNRGNLPLDCVEIPEFPSAEACPERERAHRLSDAVRASLRKISDF